MERVILPRRSSHAAFAGLDLGSIYPRDGLPTHLRFGRKVVLFRELRAEDKARLVAFFKSHTQETIASRYGYAVKEMSPERAELLLAIDQEWDAVIGAFEDEETGGQLIAIGRGCRSASGHAAEVAFVVSENWRRLGIATTLLRTLASLMAERGVHLLTAGVGRSNSEMIRVLRNGGFISQVVPGTDRLEMSFRLDKAPLPKEGS